MHMPQTFVLEGKQDQLLRRDRVQLTRKGHHCPKAFLHEAIVLQGSLCTKKKPHIPKSFVPAIYWKGVEVNSNNQTQELKHQVLVLVNDKGNQLARAHLLQQF
mgnify:CR=1 FL=1